MYAQVLEEDEGNVLALGNLALLHHTVNDDAERAEELYQRALDWQPARPGYFAAEFHQVRTCTPTHMHACGQPARPGDFAAEFREVPPRGHCLDAEDIVLIHMSIYIHIYRGHCLDACGGRSRHGMRHVWVD